MQQGTPRPRAYEQAAELLQELQVPQRLWDLPPATFSGGEKQRINLARGLLARPRLLLLDEPTASLDATTTERVVSVLRRVKAEGVAMLAIFHHSELVEQLADRVVQLLPPTATPSPVKESTPP
jgi:alpha-D-ribose 1-methylphosphonate 5-triphosphate synthase subunit PhnL